MQYRCSKCGRGVWLLLELRQDVHHLCKHLWRRGNGFVLVKVIGFPGECSNDAARFGDKQRACRHVPRLKAALKEPIEPACRDVSKIERGSARTAKARAFFRHEPKHLDVFLQAIPTPEWKSSSDQSIGHLVAAADTYPLFIEVCAAALRCRKQVVAGRVEDYCLGNDAALLKCNRYTVLREAMNEVRCAVKRINDPDIVVFIMEIARRAGFFGKNRMIRIGGLEDINDRLLRRLSDRLRTATDVQLAGVIAFHRSGFTARDAAYGVWNAVSGVLQAAVAEDLLPGSAAEVLLRPWRLVTEEGQA